MMGQKQRAGAVGAASKEERVNQEDKVVVVLQPTLLRHRTEGIYAARFTELGLTAYGETEHEAMRILKETFRNFVRLYRADGQLHQRLDQAGVQWYKLQDFDGEYEDVTQVKEDKAPISEAAWMPLRPMVPHEAIKVAA